MINNKLKDAVSGKTIEYSDAEVENIAKFAITQILLLDYDM